MCFCSGWRLGPDQIAEDPGPLICVVVLPVVCVNMESFEGLNVRSLTGLGGIVIVMFVFKNEDLEDKDENLTLMTTGLSFVFEICLA